MLIYQRVTHGSPTKNPRRLPGWTKTRRVPHLGDTTSGAKTGVMAMPETGFGKPVSKQNVLLFKRRLLGGKHAEKYEKPMGKTVWRNCVQLLVWEHGNPNWNCQRQIPSRNLLPGPYPSIPLHWTISKNPLYKFWTIPLLSSWHHVISVVYHVISCYIMWYHVISCDIMLHHVISCYIMLYHVISCYIMLHHVISCYIMLHHVISCYIMLYHAISCYIMLHHVTSCYIMLHHVTSCYIMLHHVISCNIM